MANAVSCGSCPILFKVLMLNVAIYIVHLLFSNFCCLSSEADFSNTEARASTFAGRAPVWSVANGNLSLPVFILIYRSLPHR